MKKITVLIALMMICSSLIYAGGDVVIDLKGAHDKANRFLNSWCGSKSLSKLDRGRLSNAMHERINFLYRDKTTQAALEVARIIEQEANRFEGPQGGLEAIPLRRQDHGQGTPLSAYIRGYVHEQHDICTPRVITCHVCGTPHSYIPEDKQCAVCTVFLLIPEAPQPERPERADENGRLREREKRLDEYFGGRALLPKVEQTPSKGIPLSAYVGSRRDTSYEPLHSYNKAILPTLTNDEDAAYRFAIAQSRQEYNAGEMDAKEADEDDDLQLAMKLSLQAGEPEIAEQPEHKVIICRRCGADNAHIHQNIFCITCTAPLSEPEGAENPEEKED